MTRTRSFFLREAAECLGTLREDLVDGHPDLGRAYRAARLLRGSAQMARFGRLGARAERLEHSVRAAHRGEAEWSPEAAAEARQIVEELEAAVAGIRAGRIQQDPRTELDMDGQQEQGGIMDVAELEYRGERALERALELRSELERALEEGRSSQGILDELFDLVRLGMT